MSHDKERMILDCEVVRRTPLADGGEILELLATGVKAGTIVKLHIAPNQGPLRPAKSPFLMRLDELVWPPRVRDAFRNEDVHFVGDLCRISADDLRRNPRIGARSIALIEKTLASFGLKLGEEISETAEVYIHPVAPAWL
ncbi:hypothetical protein PQU92_14370 [Asticcacaulis sp. BYS171W]|uniref:Uncharacterized protein n=1 Tax=Asticcacaulis aquaticus TaxID=2984212 RepID=A0ABT5HWK2_9CAUL|nr:DNA-directed RNA polymerase subunit alpha C-terminal domain-containing protein [Asticcacaulis aquaticus]MDC7684467.1 hypothetical protein [Asticcacaulis aquaticus]